VTRVEADAARWIVEPATDRRPWDELLAEVPTADPLQSWAWSEAGRATGEHWDRLIALDPDGRPGAAIQWQSSSPVLGHPIAYAPHGPVWRRSDGSAAAPGALLALMAGMRARATTAGVSAILVDPRRGRAGEAGSDPAGIVASLAFRPTPRHIQMPSTRVLDLREGHEASRAGWDRDTRNLVRRAQREGVEAEVSGADEPTAVDELHGLMRDVAARGGFAPRSRGFLEAFGQAAGDRAFIVLARWQGRVIGGALVALVGDRAYYQFAGSLREPGLRHANAPYAVMDSVIGECAARGSTSLDLCGVNEKDDPTADPRWEGLSLFKRGFGGEPVRHRPVATLVLRPTIERMRHAGRWVRRRVSVLHRR
jgi:lipid II:glycine glycyltransferase (peptidoglycan interpeptide bridge formation enzyme)